MAVMGRTPAGQGLTNAATARRCQWQMADPTVSNADTPGHGQALAGVALVLLVVAAHGVTVTLGFIWDDPQYVVNNLLLRSASGLWALWSSPASGAHQYYPVTMTTFWVEYHLWGTTAAGYHAVNVLLHAANAVLLWRLLRTLQLQGAWLAAALFAVHPVMVESVAWVTERKNLLSGTLYLLAMLLLWRSLQERHQGAQWRRAYAVGALLFAAALMAKTVVCSLPATLLLLASWKRVPARLAWLHAWPMLVLGAGGAAMTVFVERHVVGTTSLALGLSGWDRCVLAGRALWFYVGKLAWPADLIFIYPRWNVQDSSVVDGLPGLAFVVVVIAAWLGRQRVGHGSWVALCVFAGTLLPALGFIDVYPMRYTFVADHYQYHASTALFALAAAAMTTAAARLRVPDTVSAAVVGALLVVPASLSVAQARHYANERTLWARVVVQNPSAWMAHANLGILLAQDGELDAALQHLKAAQQLAPREALVANNVGQVLVRQGHVEQAVAQFRKALALNPSLTLARLNLARTLAVAGQATAACVALAPLLGPPPLPAAGEILPLVGPEGCLLVPPPHAQPPTR